jgi:uncharacterized low-complexity protein
MKASTIISGVSALLLCAVMAASAQDGRSALNPKGCAPHEMQTDGKAPDGKAPEGKAGEPLSDKLARSGGVICPPNVDPEIRAPTPQSGNKMPVIPPPGSPGGDPSVQPK